MKKIIVIILLFASTFCHAQKDSTSSVITDSLEILSVRDVSVAVYRAGKSIENSFTKKQWDEIMAAFTKELDIAIQESASRFINRKTPKK